MKQTTLQELTPKSLYRLMTGRLVFSGVRLSISEVQVKGMTLVSFWRSLMKQVLSEDALASLFPAEGTHPRIQSNLMNRTGASPTPRMLRIDLGERLSPAALLTLVSNCSKILTMWNYDSVRYRSAFDLFEDQCARGDSFLNSAIHRYLLLLRSDYNLPFDGKHSPVLFQDSLRLAWNALFALMGPNMNGPELRKLRDNRNAAPVALWELLIKDRSMDSEIPFSIRVHGKLSGSLLPADEYIPLSLTPREVLYMTREKGRILLTGPGGSGKTQLAYQVYSLARRQSFYNSIVMLTVSSTLLESIAALFPEKVNNKAEDPLEDIWKILDNPCLLFILDGLDSVSEEEYTVESLQKLSCDLLVTGRIPFLEKFTAVSIPSMNEAESVRLLSLAGRGCFTEKDHEGLLSLSGRLGGHPLTLRLIGSLCQAHYMKPEEMQTYLSVNGFQGLSLGSGRERQEIQTLLDALFIRNPLHPEERQIMRLLSILPEETWRPLELKQYTVDFEKTGFSLSYIMERLSAMGLLQRGLTGYSLHPVIAEVFRVPSIRADEFPALWSTLQKEYDGEISKELQERYSVTLRIIQATTTPNQEALDVLDRLCSTAMSRSRWQAYPWMLEKYKTWLECLPHSSMDEINLIACRMLWCTILPWRDQLDDLAENLMRYSGEEMLAAKHYILLVNMMEIGGEFIRRDRLLALLEKLRPPREPVLRLINYLNFLGGTQRGVLKDPETALISLQEARNLIQQNDYLNTVEDATNATRTAYTLADLKNYEDAVPLMVRVLTILKKRGYSDDSPTIRASRNALNFFRGKCGEKTAARDALKQSIDLMEQAGPPFDDNYLAVLTNYGIVLTELCQFEEAEEAARKAVKLCRELPVVGPPKLPYALDSLARILQKQNKHVEALGYYMEADALFRKYYSTTPPTVLTCKQHLAETLIAIGQTEEGNRLLKEIRMLQTRDVASKEKD